MSYAAPYLSYAAPFELSCTLLSSAVPFWSTLYPTELRLIHQRKLLWFFNTNRRCNRKSTKLFCRWEILLTKPVGMASKSTTIMFKLLSWRCPLGHGKWHLPASTVYPCGSIDANFDLLSSRWTVPLLTSHDTVQYNYFSKLQVYKEYIGYFVNIPVKHQGLDMDILT